MEQPKSQTQFDPNRTPFTSPAARFTYLDHPATYPGQLKINSDTMQIVPMSGKGRYPGFPLMLPEALMKVEQPHVRTCGKPGTGVGLGCEAAVNGGCPILQQYGRVGPCNIIIEKDGKVDSAPCHAVYCGISDAGRPTAQVHYLLDGWQILTDRTTIPENIRDPKTRQETVRYTEVPNLAPFYDHLKKAKEEEVPKPKRKYTRRVQGA
jgi:hypothetical protein